MPLIFSLRFPFNRVLISDLWSSRDDLPGYVQSNLYRHLCDATKIFLSEQNAPDDHLAVKLLNDLDTITYLHFDVNKFHCMSNLARHTIGPVLGWADMLNSRLKVCVPISFGFTFLTQLCRAMICVHFQCQFNKTSVSIRRQDLSEIFMHRKTWIYDDHYYMCTSSYQSL
jgi:hypothetical protein